ncbi:hypothetical protein QL285_023323 [Trifolium repens]|nr:hypothetical protein QL285_023323 [Trifolium repens]
MATKKTKTKSKTKEKQTTVKTKTKTKHSTVKEDATTKKIEESVNGDESFSNVFSVVFSHGGEFCDGQLYVEHRDDESEGDGFIDYDSDDVEGLDDSEDERAA